MVAIFEVSPMPSQRMSSGRSAIFGIGNSADTMGKPAARASENRPTASPTATPTAVPMIQPAPMRSSDIETCAHNSPDAASRQSARTIAKGLGRNRAFTRPSDPAACQAASTIANTSHEVAPRGAGANPVARKRTTCGAAGRCAGWTGGSTETDSRIRNFPFGGARPFAHQRPQPGMDRTELQLECGLVARATRNGNRDDVLDPSRTRRKHDDAVREPQGFIQIMGDVDDGEIGAVEKLHQVLDQELARLRIERRQRLVHEQQARTHRERAGNPDALAHAAGELLGKRSGEFREPGTLQGVGDERAALGYGQLAMLERQRDVVCRAAPGQQGKILENERDRVEAVRRKIAAQRDLAAHGLEQPPTTESSVLLPQPDGPTMASTSP